MGGDLVKPAGAVAEVVAVGDELLSGATADTNFIYITRKLRSAGVKVIRHVTVGDGETEILAALRDAVLRVELVVVTGGLGVTVDDRTRSALARLAGVELVVDPALSREIEVFFRDRKIRMPAINMAQALIPRGAERVANRVGLAPGLHMRIGRTDLFAFPGVPAELRALTDEGLVPFVKSAFGGSPPKEREVRTWGIGETRVAEVIGPLLERERSVKVSFLPEERGVTIRFDETAPVGGVAEGRLDRMVEEAADLLGDKVYSTRGEELEEVTAYLLALYRKTIAVAESCTGGLVATLLTSVPGSSAFFVEGLVPYTVTAKEARVGVPGDLIEREGVVSAAVAEELASKVRSVAGADLGVGVTGFAGPGAGEGKPAGRVYGALAADGTCVVKEWNIPGDRARVRERAARNVVDLVRLHLIGGSE